MDTLITVYILIALAALLAIAAWLLDDSLYRLMHRECRDCGCTNDDPCLDSWTDSPCYWVDRDLCSSCTQEVRL